MIADISFQPPVGLAQVVGFQAPISVAPSLGFQASLGLSTPLREYDAKRRESFSLLERSGSSLAALRLKMSERFRGNSETFRASASETWRPSSYTYKTPDIVG